jgi:uncharacterized protein YciW
MAWPSCALVPSSPGRKASSLPRLQQALQYATALTQKPLLYMRMQVLSVNYIPIYLLNISVSK